MCKFNQNNCKVLFPGNLKGNIRPILKVENKSLSKVYYYMKPVHTLNPRSQACRYHVTAPYGLNLLHQTKLWFWQQLKKREIERFSFQFIDGGCIWNQWVGLVFVSKVVCCLDERNCFGLGSTEFTIYILTEMSEARQTFASSNQNRLFWLFSLKCVINCSKFN